MAQLLHLHDAAALADPRAPSGNRLEALKGRWREYHSIRVDDRWQVVFRWVSGSAHDVAVVDYH